MPQPITLPGGQARPGWITLTENLCGRDRRGREYQVTRIEIEAQGYIPDVYVRLNEDVDEDALYDDEVFIAFVNSALKALGYEGRTFDRAELGMQGRTFIVLEPPQAFNQFVVRRYGWRDLNRSARAL